MAVVKSQHAAPLFHDAVVLDLGDLSRQAEVLLEQARAEAERIVADARLDAARQARHIADEAKEQGRREGVEQGRAEGREEARTELIESFRPRLQELDSRWSDALIEWREKRGDLLMSAREDVLRLAIALTEKITHRRLDLDASIVSDQVEAALRLLCDPAVPVVAVHPDDVDLLRECMPELESSLNGGAHITLREDATIRRGGCRIVTMRGEIDSTIETQLECIAAALLPDRIDVAIKMPMPEPVG